MTTTASTTMTGGTQGTTDEHPLAEATRDVGQSASEVVDRAANVGFQRADQGKQQVAEGLGQLAGTIRRVSTDMESEQPMIANVAQTAADQTERIATFLRETDARELLHTVEDVARRQPLLFLGGAFILGAAASRFLKAGASGSAQTARGDRGSMRSGYRSGYGSQYRTGSTYRTGYADATESYRATAPGASSGINGTLTDEGL